MTKEKEEWIALCFLIVSVSLLGIYAQSLNNNSFMKISKYVYGVKTTVGNLREGPSTNFNVVIQMQKNDMVNLSKRDGDWYYGKHLKSKRSGWTHKNILEKYLHLGYHDEFILNRSLFSIEWD